MTLTCECCPCSCSNSVRVCCLTFTCLIFTIWFMISIFTATEEAFSGVSNCFTYPCNSTTGWYTSTFQDWYLPLATVIYIITMVALLSLIIFWFCWDDGTRCFTRERESAVLILLTIVWVVAVLWVVPLIELRVTPEPYYNDSGVYEVMLCFTGIAGVLGGVTLVVIWYQNCCKKASVPDLVVGVPFNEVTPILYVPPEHEDTVLPWLIKKGDITNSWEQVDKFYRNSIDVNNKKYSYFIQLFFSQLGGKDMFIKKIFAVHNPTLFDQFNNRRKVMMDRQKEDPTTWLEHQWATDDLKKVWVYENYQNLVKSFKWNNEDPELPIIPVLHGTDEDIAWKICRSGFAALARLDAGWYGSGNYFSTSAMYCFPYFGAKKNPALILSFVAPGNVFPVTEARDGPDSLLGKPIKKRCGSHFALVTKDGFVCKGRMERDYFTEIVIEQESQILPCFVFVVDNKNFSELAAIYQRDVPSN